MSPPTGQAQIKFVSAAHFPAGFALPSGHAYIFLLFLHPKAVGARPDFTGGPGGARMEPTV
jgi:hypothetical protein